METLSHRLRKDILEIQRFMSEGVFFAFTTEQREGLLSDSQKLLDRLDALSDQILMTGILGGTGVGKSTVMNALAGAQIASTSHRRPHTDRVLVYRHGEVELPRFVHEAPVPWHEVVHQADAVRQIVLCDLPDFDSLIGEHRDRVLGFLEHLDVLVFVTSPEKYADDSFYAFLERVPKAWPNLYFVSNKADLLFQAEDLEPGYQQLTKLTSLFQGYLEKAGIAEPLVYPVSAQEAFEKPQVSPWNQFPGFRREIFRERQAKEVMAIKVANVDQEIQELLSRLKTELITLDTLGQVLRDFRQRFETDRGEWGKAGQDILDPWVETEMKGHVLGRLETLAPLIGPGYGVARVAQEWKAWREGKRKTPEASLSTVVPEPPESLRDQLKRLENRIMHQTLQHSLPASYRDRLRGALNLEQAWGAFTARWKQEIEVHLLAQRAPLFIGFRAVQFAAHGGLLVLLLMALTGEEAGARFFSEPGLVSLLHLVFSIVKSLFSMTGLGAVLTFILIQGFLGAYFYKRYKTRLERRARRHLTSLKKQLGSLWAGELDLVAGSLRECEKLLASQRNLLTARPDRDR